jgi:hypothetical protein
VGRPVWTSSRLYSPEARERRAAASPALARELEGLFAAALGVEARVRRRRYGGDDVLIVEARCADATALARFSNGWRALVALRLGGVTTAAIARLAALRRGLEAQDPADPALDGFAAKQHLAFARWLYRRGRLAG